MKLKIQKCPKYFRLEIGKLNIYLTWGTKLRTHNREVHNRERKKRNDLKQRLINEKQCCEFCGKQLTWNEARVHHIKERWKYPELEFEYSNLMLLCDPCHVGLHRQQTLKENYEKEIAI